MKKVPVEVYSRVVGFFRPVGQWNPGKKQEFGERAEIDVNQQIKKYRLGELNGDI